MDARARTTTGRERAAARGACGQVAASKLSAPLLRPGIIDRPELLDALMSATCAPVVLLSAPAGYGKSTLLALWRQCDERPFAWVSLESSDNDAVALVASVVAALDGALHLGPALHQELGYSDPPLEELVLPSLIEACARERQPFVLALDDLHVVNDRRSHAAIRYIAERLPPGCQLALATRTDPPLPLASWRAHGWLAERRAAHLSLNAGEARAMLAAAGVSLGDDRVARLVERTEGWPAALYLAALSLRDRSDPEAFVDEFAGASRHVADFLSEDVVGRQPDAVVDFLLRTSVLEELSAPLCDALTGGADADARLRELERSNLFVVPLDEEHSTYRYHHLFAQYLRAELAHRLPNLAPELHRRAFRWYAERKLVDQAVAHAQAAGDSSCAADVVATEWPTMLERGALETMRAWVAAFDDGQIESHAPLAVAAAWVAALGGDRERALHWAEAARRGHWDGPMPDGAASLESALAMFSSAFGLGGASGMRDAAMRAVDLESNPSRWRALALMLLGIAQTLVGELANARESLTEALQLSRDDTSIGATSLAWLAWVRLREGDEAEASDHARRALEIVDCSGMRNYTPSVCTYAIVAHLQARLGELDQAAVTCERAVALLRRLTEAYWWQMIATRILLAPVLAARGCNDRAATYLNEAGALLAKHPDAGKLAEWHAEVERQLHPVAQSPRASRTLTDAERRVLRLLASDLSLREIGSELLLSMNTIRTHKRSIYRKLGVSSRADAVRAAPAARRTVHRDSPG